MEEDLTGVRPENGHGRPFYARQDSFEYATLNMTVNKER